MSTGEQSGHAARTFEELHMYQRARELTNAVYTQTRSAAFARDHGLSDQIRRAAVSIMSNIAEGFERGTTPEFIQFLYIAKGSCGEVRAQVQIAADQGYIDAQNQASLTTSCRMLSGMISKFIAHLQSSNYRGEKFNRPPRHIQERVEKWKALGQAAQVANIRAQKAQAQKTPATESQVPPGSA